MFLYDLQNESNPNLFVNKTELIVNWNRNLNKSRNLSLIEYIENNPYQIKKKYLSFIHDLGNKKIKKKSLSNLLSDKNGNNLWWMSLLAEKNYYRSFQITNCLKVIALEEIFKKKKIKKLTFISNNVNLSRAIQLLCDAEKINFEFDKIREKKYLYNNFKLRSNLTKIYNYLPIFFQSLIWLANFWFKNLGLRLSKDQRNIIQNKKSRILFISNFVHLNLNKIKKNNYYSYQWGDINSLLKKLKIKSLWIHNFIKYPEVNNSLKAKRYLSMINNKLDNESHLFLTSFLNIKIIQKVLFQLIFYYIYSFVIFKHVANLKFKLSSSSAMLHLLQKDLKKSLYGSILIENLINIQLFDQILKDVPKKNLGIFSMEGHSWEKALIHAWHKYNHGKLIGYCHSTVNYWHLNYFDDNRTINSVSKFSQGKPDFVAVTGLLAKKNILKFGYKKRKILDVESLRYAHLRKFKRKNKILKKNKKILLLGDYEKNTTKNMLNYFSSLDDRFKKNFKFHFKPYPANELRDINTKLKYLIHINEPLPKIINNYFAIITSRSTAASLEAYITGNNVIIFLEKNELNTSPLFGIKNVYYLNSKDDLNAIVLKLSKNKRRKFYNNYLYLNSKLKSWEKILKTKYKLTD